MASPLILNRYRLLETKGKGGFGTVDVAWDSRLQRRVAIKRIPLAIDATDLPGIQEARTAALLNDARIVSVLDFEVTGTEALLIMENVDGPTLGTLMKESRELLDLDTITTITKDVAAALEYAHENQVLHLDIKPDNILIDHKGHIKVTDFGLSELSGTAGFAEPQGGTIGYMPPEQLEQGEVDARTDLWALAILLYQLLTGTNPFLARTTSDSLECILNDPLPLPSALRPELDPAIDEVLVQALMANKQQRFPGVAAFLSELGPLLGNAQSGRRKLKYRVNERDLDEVEYDDAWHQENAPDAPDASGTVNEDDTDDEPERAPLWERAPALVRGTLGRLVALLACGSFAFVGLGGLALLGPEQAHGAGTALSNTVAGLSSVSSVGLPLIVLIGVVVFVAFGAFLVPQLGSALASLTLIAGVFMRGYPLLGLILAVLLIVWWLFLGRKNAGDAVTVMLTPLFGVFWLTPALPLLAGLFLPWKRAVATALAQGLLSIACMAVAWTDGFALAGLATVDPALIKPAASSTATLLFLQLPTLESLIPAALPPLLGTPLTWISVLAFLLAALVTSLLAARGTRSFTVLGMALGTLILTVACIAAPAFINPGVNPDAAMLTTPLVSTTSLILSFILVLIVSLLGVPLGSPQDDPQTSTQTEEV
jgi:hypothetical protein